MFPGGLLAKHLFGLLREKDLAVTDANKKHTGPWGTLVDDKIALHVSERRQGRGAGQGGRHKNTEEDVCGARQNGS